MANITEMELIVQKLDVYNGQFERFLDDMDNLSRFINFLRFIIIITIILYACFGCCSQRYYLKLKQSTPSSTINPRSRVSRTSSNPSRTSSEATVEVSLTHQNPSSTNTRNPQVTIQP